MTDGVSDPPKPFRGPRIGGTAPRSRKRAVNVSLDEALLADAKALGINLSCTLEKALRDKVHAEKVRRFQEEGRAAFESYNRFIAKHGIFGEEFQDWDDPPV
jgi:antitoxin CcdA